MKAAGARGVFASVLLLGMGALGLFGAGCDNLLGLDQITVGCSQGQSKCINGKTRVECGKYGEWDNFPISCAGAQVCQPATGLCGPACQLGDRRCTENKVLEECSLTLEWQVKEVCSFACGDNECKCDTTSPLGCTSNNERQKCFDGVWQIEPMGKCVKQTCNAGKCVGDCEPGRRCVDDKVQECNEEGKWGIITPCGTGEVCSGGECIKECKNGDLRCSENAKQECKESVWVTLDNCNNSNKTCIEGLAICDGVCIKGNTRCASGKQQQCDGLGHWQDVLDCAAIYQTCVEGKEGAGCFGECAQGAPQCVGNTMKLCNQGGFWDYADCGLSTCVDGVCKGSCGPASGQCLSNQAQVCDATGGFQTVSVCPSGCMDGTCIRTSCETFAADCGPNQGDYCCASPYVRGGAFLRGNEPDAKAVIADFRLDKFEINVGRFRQFVSEYDTFKPTIVTDMGSHPLLAYSGWNPAWTAELPATAAALQSGLLCGQPNSWTPTVGSAEGAPMNCLTWYEAFAFCIWDGGYLPTEAEWNYAAAGGVEQRLFPWSVPAYTTNIGSDRATYNCLAQDPYNASNCLLVSDIPNVGFRSPAGDGKFGQADLAGGLLEWTLDVFLPKYPDDSNCVNCAALGGGPDERRVVRGGAWSSDASSLLTPARGKILPNLRSSSIGARCARGI